MKNVLNNIWKWALLVWISYSLVFTGILNLNGEGIIESIAYRIENVDGSFMDNMEKEDLEEYCRYYQEMADKSMSDENITEIDREYYSEEEINKRLELNELYRKYPSGFACVLMENVSWYQGSQLNIISFIMGIAIGTGIYLMLDKDKKGLKVIISLYIIFVVLLGFVEGIWVQDITGEGLTLLDKWAFPDSFIIPITVVFALAIFVRILRQKEIAKKLNEKLEEIKKK